MSESIDNSVTQPWRHIMSSPAQSLDVTDIKKILTGAGLAGLGAAAAFVAGWVSLEDVDLQHAGLLALAAGLSVVSNAIRKFLSE